MNNKEQGVILGMKRLELWEVNLISRGIEIPKM